MQFQSGVMKTLSVLVLSLVVLTAFACPEHDAEKQQKDDSSEVHKTVHYLSSVVVDRFFLDTPLSVFVNESFLCERFLFTVLVKNRRRFPFNPTPNQRRR